MCTMMEKLLLLLLVTLTGINAQINVCGQAPQNNNRIVGGVDAAVGAWPWQASVHNKDGAFCGASLINDQWLLSAAHCFPKDIADNMADLIIYLGREKQEGANPNEVSRRVSRIVLHPSYSIFTGDNDIALVQLSSSVSFTNFIVPVCLAGSGSELQAGVIAWVTGWGTRDVGTPLPSPQRLQEVDIPIVSNQECNATYGMVNDNMLCAGISQGGKDSCQGDSGGPLVVKNGSVWIECGVVSFSRGCGDARYPGVFVRVSLYESWIRSVITTNLPGFISIRMVARSSSSSITGSLRLLTLTLPLLFFLLWEV